MQTRVEEIEQKGGTFYIVVFDLDDLKKTNDTYGHAMGDELIKRFASEIKKQISGDDILSRFGGDEFVAVFFNIDMNRVRDKINIVIENLIKQPIEYNGHKIPITFSYGISSYPDDEKIIKNLITMADSRMYQDKEQRKRKKNDN